MDADAATAILKLAVFIQGGGFLAVLGLLLKSRNDSQKNKIAAVTAAAEAERLRADAEATRDRVGLDVRTHNDGLAVELLETARAELAILKVELEQQRARQAHLQHFERALEHLEALIMAENDAEFALAKRNARAFLNRMKRLAEARGTVINEVQRAESKEHLAERRGLPSPDGGDKPGPV